MSNPVCFETRTALMSAAAERMADALKSAISKHGDACIALSGGSTPEPAYTLLAQAQLDWRRVTLALVDERFVPPEHPASNEALVRRTLAPALAQGARLAPMYAPAQSLEDAADRADALYAPLRIDYALMGVGLDGHTASWFEDADRLQEALDRNSKRTVIALRAPSAAGSTERLSLTFAALRRTGRAEALLVGRDKLDVLSRAYMSWLPAQELFRLPEFKALFAP